MATQSAAAGGLTLRRRAAAPDPAAWRAYHLFYHADRDRLLGEMVRPTVAALLAEGEIRSFYFVRYRLGGPHVRLRVKPAPGRARGVDARVRRSADEFFARHPSPEPVPQEAILRENQGIVASDPLSGGAADVVFADNSVEELPVFFEVERYGGTGLLRHSLDFFALSSAAALRFVAGHPECPAGQRLSVALRLCVQQAWGLARDEAEFTELLNYAIRLFPVDFLARFVDRGDEAFERQRDAYTRLVRGELRALAGLAGADDGGAAPVVARGARRLARAVRDAEDGARWIIGASQLHMTANRLGLLNPEELYLGRILWRAAGELAAEGGGFWREVWAAHRRQGRGGGESARGRSVPALADVL